MQGRRIEEHLSEFRDGVCDRVLHLTTLDLAVIGNSVSCINAGSD